MPVLELSETNAGLDFLKFEALRLWPHDTDKRLDFMRAVYLRMEAEADEVGGIAHLIALRTRAHSLLKSLGGRRGLSESPGYSACQREAGIITERAGWVGIAFLRMYQLVNQYHRPELATWNRVAFLLEKNGKPQPTFKGIWKKFKPVAHLWAARLVAAGFGTDRLKDEVPNQSDLEAFLDCDLDYQSTVSWAQEFYRFGTSHISPMAKESILDASTAWLIEAPSLPRTYPLPSIDEHEFKTLEEYTAPKSFT